MVADGNFDRVHPSLAPVLERKRRITLTVIANDHTLPRSSIDKPSLPLRQLIGEVIKPNGPHIISTCSLAEKSIAFLVI